MAGTVSVAAAVAKGTTVGGGCRTVVSRPLVVLRSIVSLLLVVRHTVVSLPLVVRQSVGASEAVGS